MMTLMLVALLIGSRHQTGLIIEVSRISVDSLANTARKIWASIVLNPSGEQTF
jgi:hypothetical protein